MLESPQLETLSVHARRLAATPREASAASLAAAPQLTGAGGMSALQGGESRRAAVLAMQRSAGNAAVSRLVAAGGRHPATVQRAPNQDPPELPFAGDANFMLLDKERHFPIDLPDLDEFGIG